MNPLSDFRPSDFDESYLGLDIFTQLSQGKTPQTVSFEVFPGVHFAYGPLTLVSQARNNLMQSINLLYNLQGGYAFKLGKHEVSILKQGEFAAAASPFVDQFEEFTREYSFGITLRLDIPVAQTLLNEYLPEAHFDLTYFARTISRKRDVEGLALDDQIKGHLDDIHELVKKQDLANLKLKILEFLCALSDESRYQLYRIGTYGLSSYRITADCVQNMINNPLSEKRIGDIARESTLPDATLKRCFLAITGRGMGNFIKILRLRRGARLLRTRLDLNIASIARESGYSNSSKFSSSFKDEFGYKPLQYRKMYLQVKGSHKETPQTVTPSA